MSFKPEPAIWSRDTGQRMPCFDRCRLTITWMSNIKDVRYKPRLVCISWSMAVMLGDVVVVVVVVVGRTRPRSMALVI